MAGAMAGQDVPQIRATIERLNSVGYGDPDVNIFHSRDYMKDLSLADLPISVIVENQSRGPDNQVEDKLALLDSVTPERYTVPGTFEPFESNAFQSTKTRSFMHASRSFTALPGAVPAAAPVMTRTRKTTFWIRWRTFWARFKTSLPISWNSILRALCIIKTVPMMPAA